MRSAYKILNSKYPYFITSTILDWIPLFTSEKYFEILFNNFVFYQSKFSIEITSYVIMENHFHMIARCDALKKAVQSLKSYSALQILDELNIDKKFNVLNELKEKKVNS